MTQPRQITTTIIAGTAIIALIWYGIFIFSPSHIGDPTVYLILAIAEIIGMSQLLGVWGTILFGAHPIFSLNSDQMKRIFTKNSSVAVFVTVAGEPLSVIKKTLIAARDMKGSHTTYVLDDGESKKVKALASELGIEYICRPVHDGKKAGNVNYALTQVNTKYFVIFDSDHVAKPDFLEKTLPYLIAYPEIAFVQTPQYFANRDGFISGGTAEAQEVFYNHILTGKNAFNSAFCVGTNVVFRRKAIDEIGGMYDKSNSEDIWTSILLHERGWKSHYIPEVLAVGQAPNTVASYFKQQFRWARGGMEVFFTHNPLFRKNLVLDQKIQYLHSTMHFFSSLSVLALYILPLLYVYFELRPITTPEGLSVWAIHFLPYYIIIFATFIHLLGRWPLWRGFVVATTAFPAHIAAMISVLTGVNIKWGVTGVIRNQTDYVKSVAPQLLLLLLSLGAIPVLMFSANPHPIDFMVSFWLMWNSAVLTSVCKRSFARFETKPLRKTTYATIS